MVNKNSDFIDGWDTVIGWPKIPKWNITQEKQI
ncbi:hypothetical protein LCGC14_1886460 [marine sediment metagenome]|uniref:Uncharacterized protein n=1 Tax=marine sediment metagenome TaxID=412755 RepID=A0A0F9G0U1_9ZZZZ